MNQLLLHKRYWSSSVVKKGQVGFLWYNRQHNTQSVACISSLFLFSYPHAPLSSFTRFVWGNKGTHLLRFTFNACISVMSTQVQERISLILTKSITTHKYHDKNVIYYFLFSSQSFSVPGKTIPHNKLIHFLICKIFYKKISHPTAQLTSH